MTNDEPLDAISEKTFEGADEEDDPRGETIGSEAGEKPESLADIFSDGKIVELDLCEMHEGLESVRVVRESVVVAGN